MNDTQVNALMQLVPERFLDEAMDYHEAHAPKELFMPSAAKKTVPRRMLWIAAPVSAAACLAAVIGLCYVIGTRQPERPVESLQNEIIEEQPSAVTGTTAAETGTTAAETEAQRSTAVTTHTETKSAAVTVTSIVSGTAAQSGISEEPAATAAETAMQIPASDAQTEAGQPAVQTETEPLPTIAGRPYDPEIVAKYRYGDVNMDGEFTAEDCQLVFREYANVVQYGGESELTPEQLVLANIVADNRVPLPYYLDTPNFGSSFKLEVPTDYPVSFAELVVFLQCFGKFVVHADISHIPLEELGKHAWMSYNESTHAVELTYDTNWRYIDESEDTVSVPVLGTLPVHNDDLILYGYDCPADEQYLYYRSGGRYMQVQVTADTGSRPDTEPISVTLPDRELTVDAWYSDSTEWEYYPTVNWYLDGKYYHASCFLFESEDEILALLPRLIGSTIG